MVRLIDCGVLTVCDNCGSSVDSIEPDTLAQELLNLRYDCEKCGGSGYKKNIVDTGVGDIDCMCETCQGTGKGERMIAVLDKNQELPEYDYDLYLIPAEDVKWVQEQVLKAGWKKVIE